MSTEVRVKTRVIQKHGTSSDWNQATNFVPLQGEIIVYDDLKKFKIGDGTTSVIDLPFSALGIETITAGKGLTGGGSASSTTLNVGAGTGITVADDAVNLDLTYYATAESAGLMSATDKAKLDGIAVEANKYTLPAASSSALGGVQLGYSATGANIPVQLSNDKAYVALTKSAVTSALGLTPTANTGDITGVTAGNGLTGGATSGTATLNVGAGSGITVSADAVAVNTTYTTTGKNYAVAVDTTSGGLYVTVPWTDTNTDTHYTTGINAGGTGATANAAVSNPYITIKDNSTYRGQIQLKGSGATSISSDANGVITIKSTDNNTTYSAATTSAAGLMSAADKTKLDGIATGADAVSLSRSLTSGTKIGTITINGTGTDLYCQTNTDTCNTAGSHEKADKLFLVGCLSQGPYYETFSNSKCYASGGYLYSNGTKVLTSHQSLDNYSTLANTIKSLSISGKTITYTKGDGTTGTLTTQDTNTTYSNFVKSGSGAKAGLVPAPSTTAGTTKYLREDGTWSVPPDNNTTYNAATQSAAGLMSAADKKKLDGIATGANNYTYTLPAATSSALGGVKVGSNITVSSGTISLTKANVTTALGYTPPTSDTNTTYSAGTGISLSGTTFSLNSGYYATSTNSGLMSAADKAKLDGIASGANNYTYTLPSATSSTLGGVKVGSNITVSSGTISLTKANVTSALGYTPPTTNTTYGVVSTSANGLAPKLPGGTTQYLRADGTWATPPDTNTTYSVANRTTNGLMASGYYAHLIDHGHSAYLPKAGGNVTGHIYLTGAVANSSTSNTSQLVFGTSSDNHVCISSNNNALIINPTTSTTENQIVLYLDQPSSFPSGISGPVYGNASSASQLNTNAGGATRPVYFSGGVPVACTYYVNKTVPANAVFTDTTYSAGTGLILSGTTFSLNTGYYATSTQNGLMSASDKSKLDGIAAGATALSLGNTATTAAKGNHTHSTISNAFTVAAPTATTPNYPFQIKYNNSLIFKVRYDGTTYADKAYYSTGADYAEYFEWLDANTFNEDRRGLFITMSDIENGKIELAQNSDNVVGVVSANPSMVGNDAEMHWSKKYLTDVFGSYIMEEVIHPATVDQNGKLIPEYTTYEPKLNPEYNPDLEYIPRSQRKEWTVIGLLGQLVVCDDGSCWPGGYCKCGANGVATVSAEPGWRVLARLDENHIRILFK